MMRSLFSGVSGLKSHQTRMDVTGNNIANVNTTGFKSSRTTFADTLSQTLSGAYERFTKETQENLARTTALFDESITTSIRQLNETLTSMRETTQVMPQLLSQSRERYAEQVDQFVTALVRLQKNMERLSSAAEAAAGGKE